MHMHLCRSGDDDDGEEEAVPRSTYALITAM